MTDRMTSLLVDEGELVQTSGGGVVAVSKPELVPVKGPAWFTHPSFSQNPKSSFEVEDGLLMDDYERLEVSGAILART